MTTAAALTLTLTDLRDAARWQGYPCEIVGTGGNVVALALTYSYSPRVTALVSLGDGVESADTWAVSLDGETRERYGDDDSGELPVTSDADQTISDAVAWIRHAVWGDPLVTD